jgi:hypothetical protein
MLKKFESWLFHRLFPKQRAVIFYAAKVCAEAEVGRKYRKMLYSMQRSPLDESVWVRKFVTLDADYDKLEQETSKLRTENLGLKTSLAILQERK